jgi:hypothetical protein
VSFSSEVKKIYKKYKIFRFFIFVFVGSIRLITGMITLLFRRLYHPKNRIRIVFVGPIHSHHFTNFLKRLKAHRGYENAEIIQISSDPNYLKKDFDFTRVIIDVSIYALFGYHLEKENWNRDLFVRGFNNIGRISIKYIELCITCFRPNIIWIHDLQSGGYLIERFVERYRVLNVNITVCASVYGNDLYFFEDIPLHNLKLRSVLKNVDFLHIESGREREIALKLGFRGDFFPVSSFTMTDIQTFKNFASNGLRDKDVFLVIKGSYLFRSNLLVFIHEVDSNSIFWLNKKIIVVNATDEDVFHLQRIRGRHDLDIEFFKALPHQDFISLLRRSRFFLTLNLSDGIPNAVAESTYVNCIPIFSSHTGLSDSLNMEIKDLISFEFSRVRFEDMFSRLLELREGEVILLLDGLKEIFENLLYNNAVQNGILNDVYKHAKRSK